MFEKSPYCITLADFPTKKELREKKIFNADYFSRENVKKICNDYSAEKKETNPYIQSDLLSALIQSKLNALYSGAWRYLNREEAKKQDAHFLKFWRAHNTIDLTSHPHEFGSAEAMFKNNTDI